jgi:valyl-tRNA synthetase
MQDKKRLKRIAHAEMIFQRDQLRAATAAEQLDKAVAAVHQYKAELQPKQLEDIEAQVETQKEELKQFLMKARDRYVAKLKELGDPRINPETGDLV